MSNSTTGCQIKSFIPVENMNAEKLRETYSNTNTFSQVSLKWIQKIASLHCLLLPTYTNVFFSLMVFANFLQQQKTA